MEDITTGNPDKPKRPQLLNILCIFTFIGSGLAITGCLILIFFGDRIREFVENSPGMDETTTANLEQFTNTPFWSIDLLLVVVSLYGAINMFRLKKIGFHLYASANILAVVLPLMFKMEFNVSGLLITASFIGMYATNLKYMS
jgi:hypothetical protein